MALKDQILAISDLWAKNPCRKGILPSDWTGTPLELGLRAELTALERAWLLFKFFSSAEQLRMAELCIAEPLARGVILETRNPLISILRCYKILGGDRILTKAIEVLNAHP